MQNPEIVTNHDVTYLDAVLLDQNNRIKLLPAESFRQFPHNHLRLWCARHARYGIPTRELVEWLSIKIKGKKAIEIGAGNGDLGYHLGIKSTDNYCQQFPDVRLFYEQIKQAPTAPTNDIEKIDAIDVIKRDKPDVVVASWVTHKFKGDVVCGGNMYGPDEEEILTLADYAFVGNVKVHGDKTIRKTAHAEYRFPWLVSRGAYQDENVIYWWTR